MTATQTLIGYFGSPCPHSPDLSHMHPVYMSSSMRVIRADVAGWPADTAIEPCPACQGREAGK